MRAHTRKDKIFVDFKAEEVSDAYKKSKEANLADPVIENRDVLARLPLRTVEEDNDIFMQSTFTNERGHVYGIGSLKDRIKGKETYPNISALTLMHKKLEDAERKLQEKLLTLHNKKNNMLA